METATAHVRDLAAMLPPIHPQQTSDQVYRIFQRDRDLLSLAVVDRGRPIGLVNRGELLLRLSQPYGRALFAMKAITLTMERNPLVVDGGMSFDELSWQIAHEHTSALLTGFVVTEGGRYLGVGTALSMLHMRLARQKLEAAQLETARSMAESASRAKSAFLANMSHELRTPLNAIIGFSEAIVAQLFGPLGHGRYGEYARDIGASGRHLLQIINDILDLSKIEAGQATLHPEWFDPAEEIAQVARLLSPRAELSGIIPEIAIAEGGPVFADRRKFRQVLLNLLSNAYKFTPRGGRVRIERGIDAEGWTRIVVADTGIGMTAEEIAVAVEPFGQVDCDLNRRFEGTGLGLPLSRALVQQHGGHLDIESTKGVGTRMIVRLPPPAMGSAAAA